MSRIRLTNIDIARGLAALLVVWQHSSETFTRVPEIAAKGTLLADIAWSVDFGRIGVVCFFLISGFVIPFSFSSGPKALKKFAARRFFRLYPVYWLSIAGALFIGYLLSGTTLDSRTILANITMLQRFFGEPHVQGLYWTLQAEIIFYILCAGLFALRLLNNLAFQLIVCLIFLGLYCALSIAQDFSPYLQNIHPELTYIPYVLAIMFSGTLLRTVLTTTQTKSYSLILLFGPLAVFGLPAMVLLLHYAGINVVAQPIRFGFGHLLGLLLFLACFRYLKTNQGFLLWLGTISYSIYLFHPIAMRLINWLRMQDWMEKLSALHMGVYMFAVVAVTLMIASVTYLLVEKPCINWGHRLTAK